MGRSNVLFIGRNYNMKMQNQVQVISGEVVRQLCGVRRPTKSIVRLIVIRDLH